jgi:hypothetical protein
MARWRRSFLACFKGFRRNYAAARLGLKLRSLCLGHLPVFGLEIGKVRHILLVFIRLAVHRQLDVVFLLGGTCLGLEWLLASWIQLLPSVSNQFGYLCKRKVLVFHLFPDFIGKYHVGRRRALGRILVGFGVTPVLSLCLGRRASGPLSL